MSIKSLGMSLWNTANSRSFSSSHNRSASITTQQVGFGLPSPEDPDPFGVKALEEAGLEIKEAGSRGTAKVDEFDYRPSPTSPVFRLSTQSLDFVAASSSRRNSRRNSKRNSKRSLLSLGTDRATSEPSNGPVSPPILPPRPFSPTESLVSTTSQPPAIATFAIEGGIVQSPAESIPSRSLSLKSNPRQVPATIDEVANEEVEDEEDEDDDEDFSDEEDIVIEEVSTSAVPAVPTILAAPVVIKAKVVSIGRRAPPALPSRSPLRPKVFADSNSEVTEDQDEASSTYSLSPNKDSFDKDASSPNPWSEQTSVQDNESVRHKDLVLDAVNNAFISNKNSPDLKSEGFHDARERTVNPPQEEVTPRRELVGEIDPPKLDASVVPLDTPSTTPIIKVEEDTAQPLVSEHKSSISGSTLASLTTDTSVVKTGNEQSLASMIKQGLSTGLVDEDEYADGTLKYYYDDDASDYEDDVPYPDSMQQAYMTPGAGEPESIH